MKSVWKAVWRLILYKIIKWCLTWSWKAVWVTIWRAPAGLWGWWVVLGAYGLLVGAGLVALHLVGLQDWLGCFLVWLFCSRWRWNYAGAKSSPTRPLFERRPDV